MAESVKNTTRNMFEVESIVNQSPLLTSQLTVNPTLITNL